MRLFSVLPIKFYCVERQKILLFFIIGIWEWAVALKSYQQLFALIKNPKYVKMRLPKNGAVIRIEQYCKRRKDRKKPKRQEDSPCVFAYYFCRGTCHRRDTAGKESAPKSLRCRSGKRSFVKADRPIRQENRQGRGKLPPLYAAVRVRRRSYGVSRIPRFVAGRIAGHRRSLPQLSSAAWCPPPLHRSRASLPHVAAY